MRALNGLLIVLATLSPATLAGQSAHLDVIPGPGFHTPCEALGGDARVRQLPARIGVPRCDHRVGRQRDR